MNQQELVHRLSEGIASAMQSTNFCVSGRLSNIDPGIKVTDLGPLKMPLGPTAAKRLREVCRLAPYGKGTETLVNTKVRKTFELSPAQFTLTNPQWDEAIRATVQSVAGQLGLPTDRLEPELYKLLLYRTGGFFLPHRDSEKSAGMVGSLIVALPTPFGGGALTVKHRDSSERIEFKEAAAGQAPCFAAFYADCEHEVSTVTSGFRLCLAYNLVLRAPARGKKPLAPLAETTPANELASSISRWVMTAKSEPLVFALDHHYTQHGLSLDLLKGNDRATAELVFAAAELSGCRAYLCQVSRHLQQHADDGSWGRRWRYSAETPKNLQLGEVYEDELQGAEWVDAGGKRQPFPEISFSNASIVASTPLDQWKPTREEYEGFTGNAGNTLDRWYHRSALCVWHRDDHFDVLAGANLEFAIGMLRPMVTKLKKTAKKGLDDARGQCIRFARSIIRKWPQRHSYFHDSDTDIERTGGEFPDLLVQIDDPETASHLLTCAALQDPNLDLDGLVVAYCRKHGCARFANELTALFESNNEGVRVRDLNWLDRLACAQFDDPAKSKLIAKLARLAAAQFCQPLPPRHYYRDDPAHPKQTLPALLRILLISGDDQTLEQVIRFVNSHPERFSLGKVQVPALELVVAWLWKQDLTVPPLVVEWLRTLEHELSAATAQQPQPPSDWSRPAEIACNCRFCKELNEILADPQAATGRISAREEMRSHLINQIYQHECDVTHKLEKKGSPHSLVFTKTNGSFERRVQRYLADQKLLETTSRLLHACHA